MATAQIGVAKSAYYPIINLGASGGFESGTITTLLNGPSSLWSVGVSAVGTVFDVGRRRSKPGGKWSAQEHAGHLLDLESLWLARVDDFLADGDTLTVADLSNRKTHEANHSARELTEILAEFRTARLCLVDRVGKFQPVLFARFMLHPRLKHPMRLVDHLHFVAEHDDHHMARIWELINT